MLLSKTKCQCLSMCILKSTEKVSEISRLHGSLVQPVSIGNHGSRLLQRSYRLPQRPPVGTSLEFQPFQIDEFKTAGLLQIMVYIGTIYMVLVCVCGCLHHTNTSYDVKSMSYLLQRAYSAVPRPWLAQPLPSYCHSAS